MTKIGILSLLAALTLAGCNSSSSPTSAASPAQVAKANYAYQEGSIKKGDKALCVMCVLKEGTKHEENVAETIDYQGKTYAFCNEKEKAEFISSPEKYAVKP